jgi:hypothetical protein
MRSVQPMEPAKTTSPTMTRGSGRRGPRNRLRPESAPACGGSRVRDHPFQVPAPDRATHQGFDCGPLTTKKTTPTFCSTESNTNNSENSFSRTNQIGGCYEVIGFRCSHHDNWGGPHRREPQANSVVSRRNLDGRRSPKAFSRHGMYVGNAICEWKAKTESVGESHS